MVSLSRTTMVLLLSIFFQIQGVAGQPCCICSSGCFPVSSRANTLIDSSGNTCNSMALSLASSYTSGSSQCKNYASKYASTCCTSSGTVPTVIVAKPKSTNVCQNVEQKSGNFCHLCHDGSMPTKINVRAAILGYSGSKTCMELYCMARRGHFPEQLCNPLQDYYDQPCGCYSRT